MFDRLFRRRGANAAHNLSPIPRSSHPSHPILDTLDADCQELLGREPRKVDLAPARALIEDSCVLITGAGGTIGSELCRQVVQMKPRRLIMADNGEFNLYTIDQELNEAGFGDLLVPQLIDVCQREHVQTLFRKHKPSLVLHAAALKHVPIVEFNPSAAALVNVLGAKNVFDAAIEHKASKVVFISTDKAVNPTSFMGATKRLAELYAQAQDVAQSTTRFVTVRFGNVIGSTGSVAPLFARQIAKGGPVTVTHPDVQRYFMTTQEAIRLVLAAASVGKESGILSHDGRIFVLDMGEPIKIVTLAERMIQAAGLTPGKDIDIVFTRLRPGEKLFEEIFHSLEKLIRTKTDGLLLASPTMIDLPLLEPRLRDVLQHAKHARRDELFDAVHHLVPEFRSPDHQQPSAPVPPSHKAAG